jgi:hypothetical protein
VERTVRGVEDRRRHSIILSRPGLLGPRPLWPPFLGTFGLQRVS